MGLCFGIDRRSSPPPSPPPDWSYLPTDLAGLIFSSLLSHHDRLSFRAVCRQWRLGALRQHPLPPALPWVLTLTEPCVYQSLPDGVERPVPDANRALRYLSSYDGWLLDYQHQGVRFPGERHRGRFFLKNPFSNATMDIPCRFDQPINTFHTFGDRHSIGPAAIILRKIIVCSPDLVVAAVNPNNIASFQPGIDQSWSVLSDNDDDDDPRRIYEDIVFYSGKLYALTSNEELLVHEINTSSSSNNNSNNAKTVLSRAEHAIRASGHHPLALLEQIYHLDLLYDGLHNSHESHYLVISCSGKLLMVRCTTRYPHVGTSSMGGIADVNNAIKFRVFEADLEGGQWLEVNNLDGQIIFLSKACSRAIPARSSDNGDRRFGGNCIFFLGDDITIWWDQIRSSSITNRICQENGGIPMYGVYDLRTRTTSLISLGRDLKHSILRWFFPGM